MSTRANRLPSQSVSQPARCLGPARDDAGYIVCPQCPKGFRDYFAWLRHWMTAHMRKK